MSLLINALINLLRLVRNARRAFRRPPDFVWVPVTGALPEFEPSRRGLLRRRLDPRTLAPSLESIRSRLDRILADERARGVILRVENLDAGWATLEELRAELHRFRERGKTVAAYLVYPDTRSYYLASAADKVFASPLSMLNVVGLRARVNFLKDSLGRLGLETEVVAVSPYKSAADPISRSDFSPEAREQTERLLDARFDELVSEISAGRDITPEQVKTLIDNAPYSAAEAVQNKLIDGALYEDELAGRLSDGEKPARLAEWGVANKSLRLPYRDRGVRKAVGLVRVEGTIVSGRSRKLPLPLPLLGREQAGSDSVVASLRVAEKSRRIGAVLLYVDSPGGDALGSDLIWREVERIRAKKPIVVLMGNAAASGGYYVSAPASHVFARKNTITGSIGVILTRPVAAGLLNQLKVNPVTVGRGARSNLLDPRRRPTPDELAVLEHQLNVFYDGFKDRVASGRGLRPENLEGIVGGRVWTGTEALRRGLVDDTGGFREALAKARELAGITDDSDSLARIPPPRGARPAPGEPVQEVLDTAREAFRELGTARVWALSPYEISDD
ncbi:MAG: Signal peptide peptidase SppA (protease 4) [uncultured Rubrobacteraceae bacterium]|uniref:Signal peptide peptidase SppA (Protease 4) n=1 Tax=uncultured Rubrobacteraceae bacterium TaxID=349277 RepID=A0A6J4R0E7_9ACTN|nr:MAG: Signal peptide peptidase SppA (protease 4) [uncultured Rubrobacteraceae bacterium]